MGKGAEGGEQEAGEGLRVRGLEGLALDEGKEGETYERNEGRV